MIYCIKFERNEYAKKIRKSYEHKLIKERRCNMKQATLTSVSKDNMILEIMEDDDNEQTV